MSRQTVLKTYKLFIGGKFPRTESGYSHAVTAKGGQVLAHVCKSSRKDVRMAVQAARAAFSGWAGKTAYLRSQIIYRMAEMLETRRTSFVDEVVSYGRKKRANAEKEIDAAIDRLVWYAGWADKFGHVVGSHNPVAGPFFNFSVPEPMGVVGAAIPEDEGLLGLVSVMAPIIVSGNSCVLLMPADSSLANLSFCEVLAVSDLPGGVVNMLSGHVDELLPHLAGHMDVNGLFLQHPDAGCETQAAESVKRVHIPGKDWDWRKPEAQSPYLIGKFCEIKTVWHPIGS